MRIYLARQVGWGESHPLGIFSTYERAQGACQAIESSSLLWGDLEDRVASAIITGPGCGDSWIYRIDEFDLDVVD